ncbi:hypothetical protein AN643_03735 [Candidatus Epulonipiscioides saccharophilum]|nr:hypothetical protein AN643_03735 [Epulopiscium sp. SCG-B10WGA-EpuloB]
MKKNDIVLILVVSLIGILFYLGFHINAYTGDKVLVSIDGEKFGEYYLGEDQLININNRNQLEILDGHAKMISATCPDHLCVHQGEISKNNENIICLPHRVLVEVIGQNESEIDAITN